MRSVTESPACIDHPRTRAPGVPCPVCREPLAKVHNATLSGGRVAIGFRCPLCRYLTGHRWREPARYGFSLREE